MVVAPGASTREEMVGGSGHLLRELLEKHDMTIVNAQKTVVPTYFGLKHDSMIDFLAVPAGLFSAVDKLGVLRRAGRRLQVIPDGVARDHIPVHCRISYTYWFPDQEEFVQWDLDSLMREMRGGDRREEIFKKVEESLEGISVDLQTSLTEKTPDNFSICSPRLCLRS